MKTATKDLQHCIDMCTHCHAVCTEMLSQHCLEAGGKHVQGDHVRLMLDCIDICQTSANFMLRGSENHHLTCKICADICRKCADDCARVGDMDRCVKACRECAESCEEMSRR